jgi:hypothetical protein
VLRFCQSSPNGAFLGGRELSISPGRCAVLCCCSFHGSVQARHVVVMGRNGMLSDGSPRSNKWRVRSAVKKEGTPSRFYYRISREWMAVPRTSTPPCVEIAGSLHARSAEGEPLSSSIRERWSGQTRPRAATDDAKAPHPCLATHWHECRIAMVSGSRGLQHSCFGLVASISCFSCFGRPQSETVSCPAYSNCMDGRF